MTYKVKGIVCAIEGITTTRLGTAVQKIHFEQEGGGIIYPQCLGTKIELLSDFLAGDVAEVEFHISGSNGFNNVIIDKIERL